MERWPGVFRWTGGEKASAERGRRVAEVWNSTHMFGEETGLLMWKSTVGGENNGREKILERREKVDWESLVCQSRELGHTPGVRGRTEIRLLEENPVVTVD